MDNKISQRIESSACLVGGYLLNHRLQNSIYVASTKARKPLFVANRIPDEVRRDCENAFLSIIKDHDLNTDKLNVYDAGNEAEFKIQVDKYKQELSNTFDKKFKNSDLFDKFRLSYLKRRSLNAVDKVQKKISEGKNAFYCHNRPNTPFIAINSKKFITAIFHEYGHFLDYKNNPYLIAYKDASRACKKLFVPIIGINAMLTPELKKNKKDESQRISDNVGPIRRFCKKYCGLLAGGIMVPFAIEEFNASILGQKLANKYLKTDLAKKYVTKTHWHSALSYATLPIAVGLAMHITNKFRDKVVQPDNI
ncbi:MAG: hypothetical protein E7Z87_01475 [Cyanobacteria bacterium SIG26]|nr:hypothetical protein [Cyanobacteria bacterium SIG26]